jgi:hypothetical protein
VRKTRVKHAIAVVLGLVLCGGFARGDEPPATDPSEIMNALLGSLLGFKDMSETELQDEVAEIGGIPFRARVPLDYLSKAELGRYLKDVFDTEYPPARAVADQRLLIALDLLEAGTDLRAIRARLLEENIAGFYDERPGHRRLYAVSQDRKLTPANQLILAHELRHALQDQYMSVHDVLPDSVGDFDDRRVALLCLLEGDATFVMEQFLLRRLPGGESQDLDLSGLSLPEASLPNVAPVLREQLVRPYIAGRDFARAVWRNGGWPAVKTAWSAPPSSSEQVLHPAKYLSREAPQRVEIAYAPASGSVLTEGVFGELLIRPLLGDGGEEAAAGWGGDAFRVWDLSGKTLLVWRSQWDSGRDEDEFMAAARDRLASGVAASNDEGWTVFRKQGWSRALAKRSGGVVLVASDDPEAFRAALRGVR